MGWGFSGYEDASAVMESILQTPDAPFLQAGDYTDIGAGCYDRGDKIYWSVYVARPAAQEEIPQALNPDESRELQRLLEGINELRADNSLSALESSSALESAARRLVLANAGEGEYPAGGIQQYLKEQGYSAARMDNSNYGGYASVQELLQKLEGSSFVTESGFDQIGLAYLEKKGKSYWAIIAAESN